MLTFKDIVAINQEFDAGRLTNKGSLEFALDQACKTTNWIKATAVLIRAVLIDHAFEDGNKRTAAAIIMTSAYLQGFSVDKDRLVKLIEQMLKQNITCIRRIEEAIKDVIR